MWASHVEGALVELAGLQSSLPAKAGLRVSTACGRKPLYTSLKHRIHLFLGAALQHASTTLADSSCLLQ